jgi:hypothetical protein
LMRLRMRYRRWSGATNGLDRRDYSRA